MPAIKERLRRQLQAKGHDKSSAYAIASSQLQKAGVLEKGSDKLTEKGKKRQAMGAAGRAKDRAAKASGGKAKDFKYNPKTNRATKRKRG